MVEKWRDTALPSFRTDGMAREKKNKIAHPVEMSPK